MRANCQVNGRGLQDIDKLRSLRARDYVISAHGIDPWAEQLRSVEPVLGLRITNCRIGSTYVRFTRLVARMAGNN
jgi:hypothetical protein